MSQAAIVAALVGCAVFLIRGRSTSVAVNRLARIAPQDASAEEPPRQLAGGARVAACFVAAMAAWLLVGGVAGIVVGVVVAVAIPRVLARLESKASRTRRSELESAAPLVADLFAACLAAGASPSAAASASASAVGGPAGDLLDDCVAQFALGADHERVWGPLLNEEATAPIARAILRSAQTGAPLTDVLLRVADDLRNAHRSQLEQAAKAVGVKAVGPLGLCFLPAFMLLGVVPLIASLIAGGFD